MKRAVFFLIFVVFVGIVFWGCEKKQPKQISTQTSELYISAHTSGVISRESSIKVRFKEDVADSSHFNIALKKSPISFTPGITGAAVWSDGKTLEFRPEKRMPDQQNYTAQLKLSDIFDDISSDEKFTFDFTTMGQSIQVQVSGLEAMTPSDLSEMKLSGRLITSDVEDGLHVEKILSASQKGRDLPIFWVHAANRREHEFSVENIKRGDDSTSVKLKWDGKAIGIDQSGEKPVPVSAINTFTVSQVRAIQAAEKYIEIRFSDPLDNRQNIRGLINADRYTDLRYSVDGNIVRIYRTHGWAGSVSVTIDRNLRNIRGYRLNNGHSETVHFEEIKPQVRFAGKGVIIPTSQGLTLPIEAVNLDAVMVQAMSIYDSNIQQFLQVNDLEGERELRRVGRTVWQKIIPLNVTPEAANTWTRYGLDVTPLIQNYPAGMYRITLTFRREHVIYSCAESDNSAQPGIDDDLFDLDEEDESSYWDNYEYSGGNWYDNYSQRNNPCHPAYYLKWYDHNIAVSRNVLLSDIGLIAKMGTNKQVFVAVTDLRTAESLSGVTLELYNYQQQLLATAQSDQQGIALLAAESRPFLLIAQKDNQRGYLRLDGGSSLSVSHFDVAGESVQKGLKGFIYGERGVWRPGDPIYLTFILLDKQNTIPKNHPVSFELRNPHGQLVKSSVSKSSMNGFYTFAASTDADAPTGNWSARVRVGGITFEKTLKIETVMPNRLKIELDFGQDALSVSDQLITGRLYAAWLHGAIAKNLKADVEMTLSSTATTFSKFSDYIFDDPVKEYHSESRSIFEGTLNDAGTADITAKISAENTAPGMLNALFKTRVMEPGGAFSIDRFTLPYYPYRYYLGARLPKGDKARGMLLTDTTHTVRIVAVDRHGNAAPRRRVEVQLYKLRWRWWWEKEQESLSEYIGSTQYRPIRKETIIIVNGEGTWKLRMNYPDWGRYLIRVKDLDGEHSTGKIFYIDWPGWAGRGQKDMPGGASVLSFAADKDEYNVGEKVVLTIPTGQKGRGLVSIETGTAVFKTDWIESQGEQTRYEFTATQEMTPNVYAHVTFLQPHLQTGNDLPIRMYGVIPIKVVNSQTRLNPQLQAPDEFLPESTAEITISEINGKPMTYTVAIVDEGLLGLTRFQTPDPWNHFYKREALGVKTWDIYDFVAGAYGGKLDRILAIGGGEEAAEQEGEKANRFPPMVRFIGPFVLDSNKKNKHNIEIPQYVGAVRVMVVAGQDGAFGNCEKSVYVRKPLMVLGTLPRVLGPEEDVTMPVTVFALDDKIKNISVAINVKGPISITGVNKKSLTFSETGDKMVTFALKTKARTGVAAISVQASGHGESAQQSIELDVRSVSLPVLDIIATVLDAGEQWSTNVNLPGMKGTNKVWLEVSRVPPLNLSKRLQFLITYPYGCVEQTISSVFPQLFLERLLEITPGQKADIEKNIKAGIDRLRSFQTTEGGFAYWPLDEKANEWASNYAGHFLVEAQTKGYAVPPNVMDQWQKYQRNIALSWSPTGVRSDLTQAYRLYTLALANAAELGAMNRFSEMPDLSASARWRLAAAYHLAGQPEAAKRIAGRASLTVKPYKELSNTYGSELRDKAMILEALALLGESQKAEQMVKEISNELGKDRWLSTQTTAYALVAMASYMGDSPGYKCSVSFTWKNEKERSETFSAPTVQYSLSTDDDTTATLTIFNTSDRKLFPRLFIEGVPPVGREIAAQNGLALGVRYIDGQGAEIDPSKLSQGTDFVAVVTVKHIGSGADYEELALSHLVPSGWEIHNMRLDVEIQSDRSQFNYRDIRDDRVYTHFNLKQGETKIFRVLLNASYLGRFYLPMIMVETMYDESINARLPGQWVRISVPGGEQ